MTDEMIEQVARAITEVLRAKGASSRMMENAGKDAARAAIAAMREWQPIETAPTDGTRFLAYRQCDDPEDIGVVSTLRRHDPGGALRNPKHNYETWVTDFGSPSTQPTHWMPLPEPPK
jgi:hypothetical protein